VGLTKKGAKDVMEGNIPGTYFYVPASGSVPRDCAWINTSENLRFEIKATHSGSFHLSFDFDPGTMGHGEEKLAISVIYDNIKIAKGGIARINVPSEKLSQRIEAILSEAPMGKEPSGQGDFESTELESTELELEDMIKKTRSYLKQRPKKTAYEIMEEELAELEAMLEDRSLESPGRAKSVHEADLRLTELELENMAEIARLSNELLSKKGIDRADEELTEMVETIKGTNVLERLLKPVLILNVDVDGDGTVDELKQPDKIFWMRM
jgi:hypothetical protein